jgi:copper chaperone
MADYHVTGMTCGGCEKALLRAIERRAPGVKASASHVERRLRVDDTAEESTVRAAVEAAGFVFRGLVDQSS